MPIASVFDAFFFLLWVWVLGLCLCFVFVLGFEGVGKVDEFMVFHDGV